MPLVYQQNINATTRMGVWHINEPEQFFLDKVYLQREITHPHKRLQHLAGRYLLKELFPDFPYELIRIADTRKPFLENEAYHFSISHCSDYAAVIISSDHRVGTDIELTTPKVEKIRDKFLSAAEQEIVSSVIVRSDCPPISYVLTVAWSIKEAMFKWYGNGAINFKEHLLIEQISLNGNQGVAHCRFLKDGDQPLLVNFLCFNNNCLSWVLSNAT